MRRHFLCAALAAMTLSLFLASPVVAEEGETDILTLTCAEMETLPPESAGFVLAWIDGYLGGQADDTVLNVSRFQDNVEALKLACKQSPKRSVLSIVQKHPALQEEQAASQDE